MSIVEYARDYAREASEYPRSAGIALDIALRRAHELVDGGADPRRVRRLLELGLSAGGMP